MMLKRVNVVYDTPLGDCGVRYCLGGLWCTMLPSGIAVYDTALAGLWCTILP